MDEGRKLLVFRVQSLKHRLTLEVFLPLGFNDASTLLHWLRQRQAK